MMMTQLKMLLVQLKKIKKKIKGAIAQLGERLHGMQEVGGSSPPSSTKIKMKFVIIIILLDF